MAAPSAAAVPVPFVAAAAAEVLVRGSEARAVVSALTAACTTDCLAWLRADATSDSSSESCNSMACERMVSFEVVHLPPALPKINI